MEFSPNENIREGKINYEIGGTPMELRFTYRFTQEELDVRLNYDDLAKLIRTTNSRTLRDLPMLQLILESKIINGENHQVQIKLPDHIMNSTASELEARSRN